MGCQGAKSPQESPTVPTRDPMARHAEGRTLCWAPAAGGRRQNYLDDRRLETRLATLRRGGGRGGPTRGPETSSLF